MKRELARKSRWWHSMHLYRPSFTSGQCHRKVFLWCVYRDGRVVLEGDECDARKFKDRDGLRWVLEKWEEEVEVGKILHPTQSHAETTLSSPCALPPTLPHSDGNNSLPAIASPYASSSSPPLAMEELDVLPPPCSNTTQPSHIAMVNARHICGDDILAAVCHALTDGQGSPTAQWHDVESLLRNDWEQPLDVLIPSSGTACYTADRTRGIRKCALGSTTTIAAPNPYCTHCILVPQAREGQSPYQWRPLPKYGVPMIQLTPTYDPTAQMTHSRMNHAQLTYHPSLHSKLSW